MFEVHGWAVISSGVEMHSAPSEPAERELLERLQEEIHSVDEPYCDFFHVAEHNGMYSMTVSGFSNHRRERVIDVFRWLAANSVGSYGLLFVQDDEDHDRGEDFEDVFRVFRLARGKIEELDDPFLSPYHDSIYGYYEADWVGIWHAIWYSSIKSVADVAGVPLGPVSRALGARSPLGFRGYW